MPKKRPILKLFVIFGLTTVMLFELSLAKFGSTVAQETSVTVAMMQNDVNISINLLQNSFDSIIPITITNFIEGNVCEVTQNFAIEPIANILPLDFDVCLDSGCNSKVTPLDTIFQDGSFTMPAGVATSKQIYIRVHWRDTDNDFVYSDLMDFFNLKVVHMQVD